MRYLNIVNVDGSVGIGKNLRNKTRGRRGKYASTLQRRSTRYGRAYIRRRRCGKHWVNAIDAVFSQTDVASIMQVVGYWRCPAKLLHCTEYRYAANYLHVVQFCLQCYNCTLTLTLTLTQTLIPHTTL